MKRLLALLVVGALLAPILAGCNGGDEAPIQGEIKTAPGGPKSLGKRAGSGQRSLD